MITIPNEARYALSVINDVLGPTLYTDSIWLARDPEPRPKPKGQWPMQRAGEASNVTQLKRKAGK